MTASTGFLCGVIEGFYGRGWSFATRRAYADYLAEAGLNTYIYCPKADPYLRKQWQQSWPELQWRELLELSATYRSKGIYWGVGLSPFELYRHYGAAERLVLKRKVETLGQLDAPLLAILFDDMPGDIDELASRQAEIVADVCRWGHGLRILVCPTYYSFDPVLQSYFGLMPKDYWSELGRNLPPEVDVFWTGNSVCSDSIAVADIQTINSELGRQVTLWDNYPVNDGAQRSNFLYSSRLANREPSLRPLLRGHLCNPMNQGLLSLPALSGLADLYGLKGIDDQQMARILGSDTWRRLTRDRRAFEHEGLSGMGAERCDELAHQYGTLPGGAAQEVAGWLRGEYAFDPDCLTD